MPPLDVSSVSLAQAAMLIEQRQVSPSELTEAYLERIAAVNPQINAYVRVTADHAREEARRATEEIAAGEIRGPLHGIPVAVKDLFDMAGVLTEGGSRVFAGRTPEHDATVVRRLREAGAVLLGKLNTHELAYGATTTNHYSGITRNPRNPGHIPGGSSGGSGAAIAAGLAAATLGTDTGGSIRIPASLCGCVGLKPTYGRVSKAGVLPLSWLFDHPGPLTHTVEDAALMLQALAGYDPADAATIRAPVDDYTADLDAGVIGMRIGVVRDWFFDQLDPEVAAAVEAAIATYRLLGAEVRDVALPGTRQASAAGFALVLAEAKTIHARALQERPDHFGADVAALLSQPIPAAEHLMSALEVTRTYAETVRQTLETVDVLLTPATPIPAPAIGAATVTVGGETQPITNLLVRCTAPFNMSRVPAISLPCGMTAGGLPIGLQLAARPFDEATLLRAAYAFERTTGRG